MNTTIKESFDTNFNDAMNLLDGNFSHAELITMLENGNIAQKQFAALEITKIESEKEASILVSNLVNQDGKVREAVALKINELIKNEASLNYFLHENNYNIFLQGIIDVNSNICRLIIEVAQTLKNKGNFDGFIAEILPEKIYSTLEKLENFTFSDKQHVINKTIFKLYWYLETMYDFADEIDFADCKKTLLKCGGFSDYTIREKVAKILTLKNFDDDLELTALKNSLKNDENYYVKRQLNKKG